jgi:hypothetical protein
LVELNVDDPALSSFEGEYGHGAVLRKANNGGLVLGFLIALKGARRKIYFCLAIGRIRFKMGNDSTRAFVGDAAFVRTTNSSFHYSMTGNQESWLDYETT